MGRLPALPGARWLAARVAVKEAAAGVTSGMCAVSNSLSGKRAPERCLSTDPHTAQEAAEYAVFHALRSVRRRLAAWRSIHRRVARPDAVVIGTLRRPRLAIALRATVVRTETTPPPLAVFLERLLADPLSPYCPCCSLPLEPWHGDTVAAGPPIGYECRPCGTRIRWTPADVLKQMQREVRRHYAHYWAQYRAAIREHERGGSRPGVSRRRWRGGAR